MIATPSRHSSGFSLLEILVVMFIIGVIMTFITLSVGRSQSKIAEDEVHRIQALVKMAKEEAVLQSQEMAIEIYRNGYGFSRLAVDEKSKKWKWVPVSGDKLFRPRCYPPNVTVELTLEGEEVALENRDCDLLPEKETDPSLLENSTDDESIPRVFFLSSGEMTPFKIVMYLEDVPVQGLVGELTGNLQIVQKGDFQ